MPDTDALFRMRSAALVAAVAALLTSVGTTARADSPSPAPDPVWTTELVAVP